MTAARDDPAPLLTLDELSRRTAVAEATLLGWGETYAFPLPDVLLGARGLYAEGTVELIRRALEEQAAGASLGEALARAAAAARGADRSVLDALGREMPGLVRHALDKTALLAVSRAIEDEAYLAGDDVVLLGGFQHERFYRRSGARWQRFAERFAAVVAFADFARTADGPGPVEVAGSWEDPFIREWFVICHGGALQAVLVARERPASPEVDEADRTFDAVWSIDPAAVRAALRVAHTRVPDSCAAARSLIALRIEDDAVVPAGGSGERVMQRAFAALSHAGGAGGRHGGLTPPAPAVGAERADGAAAARLHDDALQRLLALRQDLEELRPGDDETLRHVRASLAQAIASVRDVISDAPVPARAPGRLPDELLAVAARVRERTGIAVDVQVRDGDLPTGHEELLVVLAREFAWNAGRHARASTVVITVVREAGTVTLVVRDDGYGFSEARRARAAAAGGLGLPLAAERVAQAGGRLEIDGQVPGGGTLVRVVLPVSAVPA